MIYSFFKKIQISTGCINANIIPFSGSISWEGQGCWIAGPFSQEAKKTAMSVFTEYLTKVEPGPIRNMGFIHMCKGFYIFQAGEDVKAYPAGPDGLEVDRDVLDDILMGLIEPGEVISFEGLHALHDDTTFMLHEKAERDADGIFWTGSREIQHRRANGIVLRAPAERILRVA